ncbi:MAG: biopolymer transporter ExbD [Spirochaetaceae bacterium]|nr:MAG: biopolymer transporter ExbD [Spirochaetaceae bacterium]
MKIGKRRTKSAIPISAMSDIAFLLLIFIMLVSLIDYREEIRIDYPESREALLTQAEHNTEIWVDQQGQLFIDAQPVSMQDVENHIVTVFLENPSTRIHIIADKDTPYSHVHEVVNLLQLLQHRVVSFVVREL